MKQKMLVNSMSNVESSSDLWYPELRLMLLTLNSEVHKLPDLIPIGPLVKMRFTKLQKLSIFIASTWIWGCFGKYTPEETEKFFQHRVLEVSSVPYRWWLFPVQVHFFELGGAGYLSEIASPHGDHEVETFLRLLFLFKKSNLCNFARILSLQQLSSHNHLLFSFLLGFIILRMLHQLCCWRTGESWVSSG